MFDTTRALYVWERANYPQYYVPIDDVNNDLLVDEMSTKHQSLGTYLRYGFKVGDRYTRVDALRSTRTVRVELDGVLLAESSSPVMVFETGVPTRYYLNRTDVNFEHLVPSDTVSECPYKGTTGGHLSVQIGAAVHEDLAWTYVFPTRQLLPITGLVAFYNEKVDIVVDGVTLDRAVTHFFPAPRALTNA